MKNYIILIVCILFFKYASAQEYYHITAKSGLNVRSSPILTSKKVAKIPFGVVVEKLEDTAIELIITDNGKEIKGNWVKVKCYNYPYLIFDAPKDEYFKEGYVFDGFLKPTKNKGLVIKKDSITKTSFLNYKEKLSLEAHSSRKIKDLDSIKILLKNRVKWQKWGAGEDYEDEDDKETVVKYIILENKQKLVLNTYNSETGFAEGYSGYYPKEEILVLEGGHSSDVSYSLKNGGETMTVGNPEYIVSSSRTNYRLNGRFGGQECVSYFLEKKENGVYKFFSDLDLFQDYDVCYFKQFYWISETEFIFSKISYNNEGRNEFEEYFRGEIKNYK